MDELTKIAENFAPGAFRYLDCEDLTSTPKEDIYFQMFSNRAGQSVEQHSATAGPSLGNSPTTGTSNTQGSTEAPSQVNTSSMGLDLMEASPKEIKDYESTLVYEEYQPEKEEKFDASDHNFDVDYSRPKKPQNYQS
eukprot:GHVP01041315.1.p1 GENE.GHVP01041315.1~~GHVP01041315.1.p1  ORF type:complete len:146 (+),score=26.93 GHVP01041315.1:29-439(+)